MCEDHDLPFLRNHLKDARQPVDAGRIHGLDRVIDEYKSERTVFKCGARQEQGQRQRLKFSLAHDAERGSPRTLNRHIEVDSPRRRLSLERDVFELDMALGSQKLPDSLDSFLDWQEAFVVDRRRRRTQPVLRGFEPAHRFQFGQHLPSVGNPLCKNFGHGTPQVFPLPKLYLRSAPKFLDCMVQFRREVFHMGDELFAGFGFAFLPYVPQLQEIRVFDGRRRRRDEVPRRSLGSKNVPVCSIGVFAFSTKASDFFFRLAPPRVSECGRSATDGTVRVAFMMMKVQSLLEYLGPAARLCRVGMSNGCPGGERRVQGLQNVVYGGRLWTAQACELTQPADLGICLRRCAVCRQERGHAVELPVPVCECFEAFCRTLVRMRLEDFTDLIEPVPNCLVCFRSRHSRLFQ